MSNFIHIPYDKIVGFYSKSLSTYGTIWIEDLEANRWRCDFRTTDNLGRWYEDGATVEQVSEKYTPIYAADTLIIGGRNVTGFDLYTRAVHDAPEQENVEAVESAVEQYITEDYGKFYIDRFVPENHSMYDSDYNMQGFCIGSEDHGQQILVWGDEALRDRIVELLNKYGE